MLQLSPTALFYHFLIFFAFLPQCKAFLTVDDPTPAQGSDFFPGQGFTLRWSGSGRSSTMNIELWDWGGSKLRKKWSSIAISSKSLSDTLPNIPVGKYYFWCGNSERDDEYGESGGFFVSLAPITVTKDVPTTFSAITTSKPEFPTPPTTTVTSSSQPSQPDPPVPSPTSGRAQRPGIVNASSVDTSHRSLSTTVPTNSSTSALPTSAAVSGSPTNGPSNPQHNSSVTLTSNPSSTALGSPPVTAIARSKHAPTGAIVGGTLGGAAILFAIFAFVIIRRRRRSSLKVSRTYIPTVSGDNIPRVTEHERSLQKAMATAPEEQQIITSDLERSAAENDRNVDGPSNEAEETQRLMNQMAIINARVQQLEIQERERQSTTVDFLSPPPMYSSTQQLPVNQGAAAFVVHNSALPSAGTGVVDI